MSGRYRKPYKKSKAPYKKKQPKKYQNKNLEKRITKLEHTEELKYIDFYDTTAPSTYLSYNHCLIAQGDDFNNRIGEEIIAKYLNLRWRINKAVASVNADVFRIIVFWDCQTNGTGPVATTSTSLVNGLLDNSTTTDLLIAPLNYRNSQRFHILYDKQKVVNAESTTSLPVHIFHKNIKLNGAKIKYTSSAASTGSLSSRSLWTIICASVPAVADCTMALSSRVWFTDS